MINHSSTDPSHVLYTRSIYSPSTSTASMRSAPVVQCVAVALLTGLASGQPQKPMRQSTSDFIQRSIFSHRPALFASIDDPEQHVYDDFQDDIPFEGIAYFAHLNKTNCFSPTSDGTFDIGIVGAPFDLGVTYRPGARFGPAAARTGSRRLSPSMGYRCVSHQCKVCHA